MSIEVTNTIEVTADTVDTVVESAGDLVSINTHEPCLQEQEPLIDVVKSEYSIVGDALFATVTSETPYWLSVLLDNAVNNAISTGLSDYATLNQNIIDAVGRIDIVENTYVEQINLTALVDGIVNSRFTTLNARVDGHDATIVDLATVQSTIDNSIAINNASLDTQWNDDITSSANTITAAYSAADATLTSSINALTSSFTDQATDITANATAVQGLQTFVGVDGNNVPDGTGLNQTVTSHSTAFTNLENGVTGPTGQTAYSLANLEVRSEAYADASSAAVENKFEYNSLVNINGQYHTAGFGLENTGVGGTGTQIDPFESEFWINAERFKFTNTNQTGQNTPFSIDASGATPQVTFNGIVTFSNINGAPTHTSGINPPVGTAVNGSTYQETGTDPDTLWVYSNGWVVSSNPDALVAEDLSATGTTIIDGGRVATNTLDASKLVANSITSSQLSTGTLITTSAQIGNAVVGTAQIDDLAVTDAKIGNAAITNAKIGTAAVDTLKIAGQAVTIPSAVYTSGSIITYANDGWEEIQTLTYTSSGAKSLVTLGAAVIVASSLNGFNALHVRLKRNGSVVRTWNNVYRNPLGRDFTDYITFSIQYLDTSTSSGSRTYSVEVDSDNADNAAVTCSSRALTALEVKR